MVKLYNFKNMYLISSCLVGVNCRYNGTSKLNLVLRKMIEDGKAIAVCPEVLAGLPTPRDPCEIQMKSGKKRVISKLGKDFTSLFNKGAIETLKICKSNNISKVILQSKSPSCGYKKIYDGSFSGKIVAGNGLTADLLCKNGIKVFTETDFDVDDNEVYTKPIT